MVRIMPCTESFLSLGQGAGMADFSIGKFQVIGTLGTGANSTILHIRRGADSKHYALKVVPISSPQDAKFLTQARHELAVAQMLDHPNLIKIYALETHRDWLFRIRKVHLLIEYVNGRTLDKFERLSIPILVQIFRRVAEGLAHMHRRRVYHADLKPNNIMLSRAGDVKILDYGLAWIKGENKGRVQGTPEYIAPETVSHGIVNERTDIFNFGATMYRLVTWRFPPTRLVPVGGLALDAKTWKNLLTPVQEANAEAPPALCQLIHHCLMFEAHQRPAHVKEIQPILEQLIKDHVRSQDDLLESLEW